MRWRRSWAAAARPHGQFGTAVVLYGDGKTSSTSRRRPGVRHRGAGGTDAVEAAGIEEDLFRRTRVDAEMAIGLKRDEDTAARRPLRRAKGPRGGNDLTDPARPVLRRRPDAYLPRRRYESVRLRHRHRAGARGAGREGAGQHRAAVGRAPAGGVAGAPRGRGRATASSRSARRSRAVLQATEAIAREASSQGCKSWIAATGSTSRLAA